jgi:peptidoglycan/LPS O-acetylase OafA/YrhL
MIAAMSPSAITGRRELPRTYYAFAFVLLVGFPAAYLANGQHIEHFWRGLAIVLFLLWRIARRGRIVWTLMVVWNAFLALAIVGTTPLAWTAGAPLLFACALASVVLLLSPAMREHMGMRGLLRRGVSSA